MALTLKRFMSMLLFLAGAVPALFAQATIRGEVRQAGGQAVAGALVTFNQVPLASGSSGKLATLSTRTDALGHFALENVPSGRYGATVMASGFQGGFWGNLSPGPDGLWKDMAFNLAQGGTDVRGTFKSDLALNDGLKVYAARISQDAGDVFYAPEVTRAGFDLCLGPGDYILRAEMDDHTWGTISLHVGGEPLQRLDLRIEAHDPPVTPSIEAWMKANAVPLGADGQDLDSGSMTPFGTVIGTARVVAFGEFAHGSSEFFQVGSRALKYLIEKRGFNALAIEAPFTETLALNRYVVDGEGNPEEALDKVGFWIWNNEEMLSTIRWMRSYNQGKPSKDKIRIYGFDLQSGNASAKALLEYLSKRDIGMSEWAKPFLAPVAAIPVNYSVYGESLKQSCASLSARLLANREALEKQGGRESFAVALEQVAILSENCDWALEKRIPGRVRDLAMAKNIGWIFGEGGARSKLVIWGHNGHVADKGAKESIGTPFEPYAFDSMGHHLRERFGDQLVIIGSDCYGGAFNAIGTPMEANLGLTQFEFPAPTPGSFGAVMARVPSPAFLLDIRKALHPSTGPIADWMRAVHTIHSAGAEFDPQSPWMAFAPESIGKHYDAIVYTRESTATLPSEGGRRDYRPASEVKAPTPTNLGFEFWGSNGLPSGWFQASLVHDQVEPCKESPHGGASCVRLHGTGGGQGQASALMQTVDATPFRGKRIVLKGWTRTRLISPTASVSMSIIVTRPRVNQSSPGMMKSRILAPAWSEQSLTAQIPGDAVSFSIVLALRGAGDADFDDLAIHEAENVKGAEDHGDH